MFTQAKYLTHLYNIDFRWFLGCISAAFKITYNEGNGFQYLLTFQETKGSYS